MNCSSRQKRISKTFPFLSKILDKLQPLQQNRHSATDQVKFLTTSRQWTAHETEPNSQEVFSERQVSWCLIRRPYLRKEPSLKMRRQQVTLNMRVKMRHFLCRSSQKFYLINGRMAVLWQRS